MSLCLSTYRRRRPWPEHRARGWVEATVLAMMVSSCAEAEKSGPAFPCPADSTCCVDLSGDAWGEIAHADARIWFTDEAPAEIIPLLPECYPECAPLPEIRWIPVPGGSFHAGCLTYFDKEASLYVTEDCFVGGLATYWTTVDDFSITETEITVAQFKAVMGFDPSCFPGVEGGGDLLPVECVDAFHANLMCLGISGRLCFYDEWQRAAQGGDPEQMMCYGEFECLDPMAWYAANSGGVKHPVGQKQPNGYGLYDMIGNVAELSYDTIGLTPGGGFKSPVPRVSLLVEPDCLDSPSRCSLYPVGIRCCR